MNRCKAVDLSFYLFMKIEYAEPTTRRPPSTTRAKTTPMWNRNDPKNVDEGSYRKNDDVTRGTHDHKGRKSYIHKMSSDTQLLGNNFLLCATMRVEFSSSSRTLAMVIN